MTIKYANVKSAIESRNGVKSINEFIQKDCTMAFRVFHLLE